MPDEVFVNGRSLVHRASSGGSIAAFPDVCASPPGPPNGPLPVAYPSTAFARDLVDGSRSVLVCNAPVCLRDRSRLARSTGAEPATRSYGGNVISGAYLGGARFVSWSLDVMIEGYNACRHLDLTIHNYGGTSPWPYTGRSWTATLDGVTESATPQVDPNQP